jgi:putative intracellular protease/amidase
VTSVLAVVTSSKEHDGFPTGFWLPELAYPYHHLTKAGITVDVASPAGGDVVFNPLSDPRNEQGVESGDLVALGFLSWKPAADLLAGTIPLADVDPSRYASMYTVGGTGPAYDLVDEPAVIAVQEHLWADGKPLGAICHGVVALAGVRVDGRALLDGVDVTGYSREEDEETEAYLGRKAVPVYPEDLLRDAGPATAARVLMPAMSYAARTAGS